MLLVKPRKLPSFIDLILVIQYLVIEEKTGAEI